MRHKQHSIIIFLGAFLLLSIQSNTQAKDNGEEQPQPPSKPLAEPPARKAPEQQQYSPQQPQEQEHQHRIYQEELKRKQLKEQLMKEQLERQAQRELELRQQQHFMEQQQKEAGQPTPLKDQPDSTLEVEPDQFERQPIPVEAFQETLEEKMDEMDRSEEEEIANELNDQEKQELGQSPLIGKLEKTPESKVDKLEWHPNAGSANVFADMAKGEEDEGEDNEDDEDEEELPPGSLLPQSQEGEEKKEEEKVELTAEEKEAEKLFQAGEKLINATYSRNYKEAYLHFLQASNLGHRAATEHVAYARLFGDYLPQNVTKAAELFNSLASKGSPRAQMGLAFMYSAGFHYNSSQAKALIYSTFGALGGDPMAQMALGYRYYAGVGVESKCESALTWYRKVATTVAGSTVAGGGPVVQRIRLQEEAEAAGGQGAPLLDDDLLQYYHFLADKGDQQAQVVLGTLYYQGGKGVGIDHQQAYHYFTTAAEGGSGHAMGYLGKMHSEGSPSIPQSNHTALEYFKKSADKKNHVGQAGLGMMYLNGHGVDKNVDKARAYFLQAADQGSVDGQLQLGIMHFTGAGGSKDYKQAVKYFTMASQNGHVLAFYNLAQMHAQGMGVLRNCHTAVELFKNVAERGRWAEGLQQAYKMQASGQIDAATTKYMFLAELGYEVAQSNVAYLLDTGATEKFTEHETHQRALLQFSRAASQGSTAARLKMGDYHYYGLGTTVDYESAASHYRVASEQLHNAQAMFNLGYMHERGLGLKQDVHLAKRFYDMAAETHADAALPATLALAKLGLLYGVDVFAKELEGLQLVLRELDPAHLAGPQWDLYLAALLAALVATIMLARFRR